MNIAQLVKVNQQEVVPMQFEEALSNFQKHLASQGLELQKMTPALGIAAFVAFYESQRVDGCLFETDGDMLLFQWGTYDWGNGETFELDITRQLIASGEEEDDLWQLSLTFQFEPTDVLRGLGSANCWCRDLQELAGFEKHIHQSAPFQLLSQTPSHQVKLDCFRT